MSFADTLFQAPLTVVPFSHLVTGMVQLTVLGAVLMFFRPLLIGIARALVLVVRPRPTKDQLAARRKLNAAKQADLKLDTPSVGALGSRS
jgi:hypothetical protein